jgi:hypothetical protein
MDVLACSDGDFYVKLHIRNKLNNFTWSLVVYGWYVQNVSTFPNTFAVVSPLICVFWIQITPTDAVFSRIAQVSYFCAEIQLSGKIPENIAKILFYQKTHEARVRDRVGPRGHHTTWWHGPGQAAPGVVWPPQPSPWPPPSAYIYPLTWKYRGFSVFPDRVPLRRHHQKLQFGTRNSVLAPWWDGHLEEIITIIITDMSPSTIHDSPSMCEWFPL